MNIIEKLNKKNIEALNKDIPDFSAGDTVKVNVKIVEGTRKRIQAFEGVCILKKNRGVNSSFTVRKMSSNEGVERRFPLHSPKIESIEVVKVGNVRRSKLYYMRDRKGKSARISERKTGRGTNK
jgi:large subunit ribosomal protein L19